MCNFLLSCSVTTSVSSYYTLQPSKPYTTVQHRRFYLRGPQIRDVTDSGVDVSSTDTFTHTQLSDCSTRVTVPPATVAQLCFV